MPNVKEMSLPTIPAVELQLMAALEQMAAEMLENTGQELEEDTELLSWYGEQYMEDLSEAGYSQTPRAHQLSSRALANLLRVDAGDLARLKALVGFNPDAYHKFALAYHLTGVLSRQADLAPALPFLLPPEHAEPKGPFYADATEFELCDALALAARAAAVQTQPTCGPAGAVSGDQLLTDYIGHLAATRNLWNATETLSPEQAAAVKLAGLFRFKPTDLRRLARKVAEVCADKPLCAQPVMAHAVLGALAATPRLVTGLLWSQANS